VTEFGEVRRCVLLTLPATVLGASDGALRRLDYQHSEPVSLVACRFPGGVQIVDLMRRTMSR
jgi:hypothetical protein